MEAETHLIKKRSRTGLGLFTSKPIKRGACITEYRGEHITSEEADRRGGKYLFTLSDTVVIDGKGRSNIARYFNHCCQPNCYAEIDENETHIYFFAKRAISAGEELTFDYGKEYFDDIIKPIGCKCVACTPPTD